MTQVRKMGGQRCAYFLAGRCTRTRSPAESAATRCHLLEHRRKVGAETMDRLERLKRLANPEDREVARRHVIQKNLDAITSLTCANFVPKGRQPQLCQHQHLVYCVLLLPQCEGLCDHFMVRRQPVAMAGNES